MKKKLLLIPLVLASLTVGFGLAGGQVLAGGGQDGDIVGVWEVDAAAPYAPHLFTFHEDGTMTTTNPTNVQEKASEPHGGTNDSLGMGVWKVVKERNDRYIVGTFEQLNAFADNHLPAPKLSVSFKVKLTNNGNGFDGPASARVGNVTLESHLKGTAKVRIDQAAVNALALP